MRNRREEECWSALFFALLRARTGPENPQLMRSRAGRRTFQKQHLNGLDDAKPNLTLIKVIRSAQKPEKMLPNACTVLSTAIWTAPIPRTSKRLRLGADYRGEAAEAVKELLGQELYVPAWPRQPQEQFEKLGVAKASAIGTPGEVPRQRPITHGVAKLFGRGHSCPLGHQAGSAGLVQST